MNQKLYDYAGVIHVHSLHSDGMGTMDEIVEAARKVGLDFVMMTDHSSHPHREHKYENFNPFKSREDGYEGWQGNVLMVIGQEITPRYSHYIAFGAKEPIHYYNGTPQQSIDEVNRQGGIGFIAHPDHVGTKKFGVLSYRWVKWGVKNYTGMSIWDLMTDWQEKTESLPSGLFSYFFPGFVLAGPKDVTLKRWDKLCQERKIVGIGESDNHAAKRKVIGFTFTIFHYHRAFKLIRNHVLMKEPFTGDDEEDIQKLFTALKRGNSYVCNDRWHPAKGFEFVIEDDNQMAIPGDSINLNGKLNLKIKVPLRAKVRLIRNGIPAWEGVTEEYSSEIKEKGIYRIEAFQRRKFQWKPWIFSNPIYVQ